MKNKRIKIIDFYSINNYHEIVTFCLLQSFSKLYSDVEFILGNSAYNNLINIIKKHNIKLKNVMFRNKWVVEKDTSLGAFLRMLFGFFFVLKEYIMTNSNKTIYYNYNNPLALPYILFINRIVKKDVLIIFHGELELLINYVPNYKISALYKLIHYYSFKYLFKGSYVKALVLGDSIKENLVSLFPNIKENVISIEHPYIFTDIKECKTTNNKNILTIGTVGHLTPNKGLYDLIKLGDILNKQIHANKVKIKVVGKTTPLIIEKQNIEINWKNDSFIPRDIFEKEIDSLDFILFLYPNNSYKLTASGALLDAIAKEKPIIALNNSYFQNTLKGYEVGILCNSLDEIATTIIKLVSDKDIREKMLNYTQNIKKIKEKFMINNVTNQLKMIL